MTVEPFSQLTMRIVPASTSRRNPATMSGTSTSTATGIATTRSHWGIIDSSEQRSDALRANVRDRTAIAAAINVFNPQRVPGANPDAGGAIFGTQGGQYLHDLSVDFGGDEPIPVRIERGDRPHLVLETALECERGRGCESHQEIPHRPDEHLFEEQATGERDAERQRDDEDRSDQHAGRSEADEQAEEHAGRRETPQPRGRRAPRGPMMRVVPPAPGVAQPAAHGTARVA